MLFGTVEDAKDEALKNSKTLWLEWEEEKDRFVAVEKSNRELANQGVWVIIK